MSSSPQKIVRGFFYVVGSGYAARAASVGLTVFLTRELGPDVFAEVVLGVTLFSLLSSLREFGLLHALLHFQDQVEEFVQTHFALNLLINLASCLLSCGIALGLVLLFPGHFSWTAALVVWIFSCLLLLRQATLTSEALLRMDFEFGRLSLFHSLGTVLALGGALWMARAGWGEWSLILGGWGTVSVCSAVYVLLVSGATWWSRPLKIRPLRLDPVWCRRLLRYGGWIWIGWVLQTFILWYDRLVVMLAVGEIELALYNHALWLVQFPTAVVAHLIFSYTNTLYSRYQADRQQLSRLFTRMMSLIVRVSSPLALVFVLNAWELMALMPKWMLAAPIVVWLSGYAFLRPFLDEGFGLLWAVGATRLSARVVGVQAGIALVLLPVMALFLGVQGVAYAMGVVTAAGLVGLRVVLRGYVQVDWRAVFQAPLLGLLAAGASGIAYSRWAPGGALADFLARSGLMVLVYGGVLALCERRMIRAELGQIRQMLRAR